MSINWEKSAELNNCTIDELKARFERFPKSSKKIVAVCNGDNGCPDRILPYYAYSNLCHTCANNKMYDDPSFSQRRGKAIKKAYQDDPTLRERQSNITKKRYEDPKEREKLSIAQIKRRSEPKDREKTGLASKERYAKMEDPGLEICNHHIAYDLNNPDALTVQVTRRFHGHIHNPKGLRVFERGYSLID